VRRPVGCGAKVNPGERGDVDDPRDQARGHDQTAEARRLVRGARPCEPVREWLGAAGVTGARDGQQRRNCGEWPTLVDMAGRQRISVSTGVFSMLSVALVPILARPSA
jgi:hypothetical protein